MWRRTFDFVFFWLPAIVHLGLLATALIVTIENRPTAGLAPNGVDVVLEPLRDRRGYTRTIMRQGEQTIRRTCEAGRCELMVGSVRGYTLLASYRADRTVSLRTSPHVEITRIFRARDRTSSRPFWIATLLSGILALLLLGGRLPGERSELDLITRGLDARMSEDGELRLADGRSVCVTVPLPPGPALALHLQTSLGGAPYRGAPIEIWKAVAGSKADHLVRVGAAIGATKVAIVCVVCANLAALGTILLGLA